MQQTYFLRFLSNMYDFILVLFFYNHILKMFNFWDKLFYETVELEQQNPENDEQKQQELMLELEYA